MGLPSPPPHLIRDADAPGLADHFVRLRQVAVRERDRAANAWGRKGGGRGAGGRRRRWGGRRAEPGLQARPACGAGNGAYGAACRRGAAYSAGSGVAAEAGRRRPPQASPRGSARRAPFAPAGPCSRGPPCPPAPHPVWSQRRSPPRGRAWRRGSRRPRPRRTCGGAEGRGLNSNQRSSCAHGLHRLGAGRFVGALLNAAPVAAGAPVGTRSRRWQSPEP
jgi:hypothetical protein